MRDAVVIGGGPAGLAAATWLARYRRDVLVVDAGEHRNRWVETSHGYLGFDPASPRELLERARESLLRYRHAALEPGRVIAVRREPGHFVVTLDDTREIAALRLVFATGVVDGFPEVENFLEHYGASVFHCPTCDGLEAQDRHVVALGWNEHIAGFALTLLDWAAAVTVVTDGRSFPGSEEALAALDSHGVAVLEDEAVRFVGTRGDLRGVVLRGGALIPCSLVFFSVAHRPRNELARSLGCAVTPEGCLVVDPEGMTTVPDVYAAGDLTPGVQLVQVAAAKGAVAGIHAALSLRGTPGAPASPEPGPDVSAVLDP